MATVDRSRDVGTRMKTTAMATASSESLIKKNLWLVGILHRGMTRVSGG